MLLDERIVVDPGLLDNLLAHPFDEFLLRFALQLEASAGLFS